MKVNFTPIKSALDMCIPKVKPTDDITKAMIAEGKKELKDIYVRDMTKVAVDLTMLKMIKNPQTIPEKMRAVFPEMVENLKKARNI